jgi:hypothetical protein
LNNWYKSKISGTAVMASAMAHSVTMIFERN